MAMVLPRELLLVYMALLGAIVGSFLNVVIARLPEGESVVRPRSRCPHCRHPIAWYDNIPILSYLLLRGHCRHCKAPIALRYPLVEALMTALAAALWLRFGWSWEMLIWFPLAAALLAIVFLDIDHWWVPDVITYPAIAFAALAAFLPGGVTPLEALLGLAPAGLMLIAAWIFEHVTGREGMGLGDVKLLALLGLALGAMPALTVLFLAAVQGSVIGVIVLLTGGHRGADARAREAGAAQAASTDRSATGAAGTPIVEPRANSQAAAEDDDDEDDEDTWEPHPRAIPFGPFLALATFELVLLPQYFAHLPERIVHVLTGGQI